MHINLSGPTKTVHYREVSTVRGVCYKRFHCTVLFMDYSVLKEVCMLALPLLKMWYVRMFSVDMHLNMFVHVYDFVCMYVCILWHNSMLRILYVRFYTYPVCTLHTCVHTYVRTCYISINSPQK